MKTDTKCIGGKSHHFYSGSCMNCGVSTRVHADRVRERQRLKGVAARAQRKLKIDAGVGQITQL